MTEGPPRLPRHGTGVAENATTLPAGRTKPAAPDDPMSLAAMAIPDGDLNTTAEAFVEEYARLGSSEEMILQLFRRPFFRGTHLYYVKRGEAHTRAMVRRILSRTGIARFSEKTHHA